METERKKMHPLNKMSEAYDFPALVATHPPLKRFILLNEAEEETIDFFDPFAVRSLNKALLKFHYGITYWNLPKEALCPPIPGRADYIYYISDLMASDGTMFCDKKCRGLDIGVGSNCIYPIIGSRSFDWTFVGSDINRSSIENARKIVTCNPKLAHKIELRRQPDCMYKFKNIIQPDEYFDFTICNPPFHDTNQQEAYNALPQKTPNFGGVSNELWCEGGELRFISDMIEESKTYAKNVGWFTSLVAKEKDVALLCEVLRQTEVTEHRIISLSQGQKTGRFIAWRF